MPVLRAVTVFLLGTGFAFPASALSVQDSEAAVSQLWTPQARETFAAETARMGRPQPMLNPYALHARLEGEPRDERWAKASEDLIRSKMENVGLTAREVYRRVTCKTSICEAVVVVSDAKFSVNGELEQSKIATAMQDVTETQGGQVAISMMRGPGGKKGFSFLVYYAKG